MKATAHSYASEDLIIFVLDLRPGDAKCVTVCSEGMGEGVLKDGRFHRWSALPEATGFYDSVGLFQRPSKVR